MFSDEEEVLLEQFISYKNMSKDKRDLCVKLLLNTKEISDSDYRVFGTDKSKYKLVDLHLSRKDGEVTFNGSAWSENEIRLLDGVICKYGNKYLVIDNIYRMNEYLRDEDKYLISADTFVFKNGKVIRRTSYNNDSKYFERECEGFEDDIYEYYYDMIYPNQKKLINTKKDTNE